MRVLPPFAQRRTERRSGPVRHRVAGALAFSVAAATAVATALPASAVQGVAAADTPLPSSVTLAGSLQSELGCSDDWQAACDASELERVGDTSTFARTVTLPAGSYAYKVTIDGSWDVNYGDGGVAGGGDIPLTTGGDLELRFVYDHETHLVTVTPTLPSSSVVTAEDRRLATPSLREDLTKERFYFVMTDRFENGSAANDTGGLTGDRLTTGLDPTHKGFYHGGDLAGLTKKLDYIKGLGTTAIWLTPSFKNKPVQGGPGQETAGYHGYWITDFTQIDPHLGTNAELKAMIDAAHAKGMKVFFDIITNHTADVVDYRPAEYTYVPKGEAPYKDAAGNVFDDKEYAGTPTFPELSAETSFPRVPFVHEGEEDVKVPAWLNDVTMYHNRGDSTFAGESTEYGDFIGLDDLFTERPEVVDGMGEIYKAWVEFGIDGFRIDTVKHVNMEFWQKFNPEIAAEAQRVGNPDFFTFGEVFDADPKFMSNYTTDGKLQATLDFGFQQRAAAFAQGKSTNAVRDLFADDDWYTDADSNAYSLPTFLGNHDMGRIAKFIKDGRPGAGDAEVLKRDQLVHALMYLTRGQPVVYYGDEQGFVGDGGDQDARQDMFPSKVATYNDDDLVGTRATTAQANFDTKHPLYRTLRDLSALRDAHPALADGTQVHRYSSAAAGVYVVSRVDRATGTEYLVALNNSMQDRQAPVATYGPGTTFRPVWGGGSAVRGDAEGRLSLAVPALSARVLAATRPMVKPAAGPKLTWIGPNLTHELNPVREGANGAGRVELRTSLAQNAFAEVSYAWRVAGAKDWTKLGTDDNAPYRVMPTAPAKGTLVEVRAVAKDAFGRYAATSTWARVGDPASAPEGGVDPVVQPDFVSVPGDLNSEMGCAADWSPDCEQAQMTRRADDVWEKTVTLPAGPYAYKVALNKSWDENYGAGAAPNGPNIELAAPAGPVTFYYDRQTNWITDTTKGPIITAAGSFQDSLGCSGEWLPDCMRSWLKDPDGDGTYTFRTDQIPAGSYETKVAHGLSWDENYGAGGTPNGSNIAFSVPADGVVTTFSYVLSTHVLTVTTAKPGPAPDLSTPKAHWVTRDLLAVPADSLPADVDPAAWRYRLHWSTTGRLGLEDEGVTGGQSVPLRVDPKGLPASVLAKFPALAGYVALRVDAFGTDRAKDRDVDRGIQPVLRSRLALSVGEDSGVLVDATGVQIPGVLDDVFSGSARSDELGVTFQRSTVTFRLWAPTAQQASVLVWPKEGAPVTRRATRQWDGTFQLVGPRSWKDARYLWSVQVYAPSTGKVETNRVTDPYSVALTTNSAYSVAVDLADPKLAPAQWRTAKAPALAQPEDSTIYELHVRDFSVDDAGVPAAHRGSYLAFADEGAGRKHLRALAQAGLNTVHLLPTFDIATIEEDRAEQATPPCDLASFPADSPEQQACIAQVADADAFNWGYDPFHFSAPEGSYAVNPDGGARVAEFRTMVGALHADGLRVVLDQVFNHTASSGQADTSVLDKVVPGYYQRLNPRTGAVETSTCCQNVATEHAMAEKLMVDSVVSWTRHYKVDGFRFDLMGHHSKANMLAVRSALDALTLEKDGVDGKGVYVYGEGWNFGEVANDALFEQARQGNLDGTGIGTFSDRLRDAVRGGGPFDEDPRVQGFGSGLFTTPNASPANGSADEQRARLLHAQDLVKLGMAGNLRDYTFVGASGDVVRGDEVDYNGSPAGYASDPEEIVTYVDAHDNETLWDSLTFKLPTTTPMADRVRMNTVSLATVALSQTPAFFHAGTDLLRSKSLDRNSYNSGDWFNHIGWDGKDNGFGRGLPPAPDNEAKWDFQRPLLADASLKPTADDVATATAAAQDLLRLRFSTPLFRLGSAQAIEEKVSFPLGGPEQTPGVVVMRVDDTKGTDVDPALEGLLVVLNASPEATTQTVPGLAGAELSLSPVQAGGSDDVVKGTSWDAATGSVTVPARSVAVLVQK